MNRQAFGTTPAGKKVSLWTPWGIQRVADADKPLRRPKRRKDKTDSERPIVKRAARFQLR